MMEEEEGVEEYPLKLVCKFFYEIDIINPVIPGLNSMVVEWASNYNITPDDLIESFGNLQSEFCHSLSFFSKLFPM